MNKSSGNQATIIAAVIGLIGVVAAATIAAVSQQSAVERPIRATQTAEAQAAATAATAMAPASSSDDLDLPTNPPAPPATSAATNSPATNAGSNRPPWELLAEPPIARNFVGGDHLIYVTLRDLNGYLVVGETVHLEIVAGPHAGLALLLETNADGQGIFTYTGNKEGRDIIHIWAGAETYAEAAQGTRVEATHEWL